MSGAGEKKRDPGNFLLLIISNGSFLETYACYIE